MTKHRKTVEKPAGHGVIRTTNDDTILVRYSLLVSQVMDDEADTGHLAGQLEIRGTIEVDQDQGMVDLGGQLFTLKTKDGRCLEASAKKGDPLSRQWEIVAAGPKGLEPC